MKAVVHAPATHPHATAGVRAPSWSASSGAPVAHALVTLSVLSRLAVGRADDPLEREAETVAARIADPAGGEVTVAGRAPAAAVRRDCGCGGTCKDCVTDEVEPVLRSTGEPLAADVRARMEPRFGVDFSAVRLHHDAAAASSALALGAHAYTLGADIVFGAGRYAPETPDGMHLLAHELTHVVQAARGAPARVRRLGANPGCSVAEANAIHQGIFDARGWLNKAIPKLEATPLSAPVLASMRRNFGATYGAAPDAPLIVGRLRTARTAIGTIPYGCAGAVDATCAAGPCGYAVAGSHAATICTNNTLTAAPDAVYVAGCVLHEGLHATFSGFTVDEYSGWHGHSGSTGTYPGTGTDPLLNADSYTSLVMDLS
jgi:hypothetical protein